MIIEALDTDPRGGPGIVALCVWAYGSEISRATLPVALLERCDWAAKPETTMEDLLEERDSLRDDARACRDVLAREIDRIDGKRTSTWLVDYAGRAAVILRGISAKPEPTSMPGGSR